MRLGYQTPPKGSVATGGNIPLVVGVARNDYTLTICKNIIIA